MSSKRVRTRSITKDIMATEEILQAIARQQKIYLDAVEESKKFYVSTVEASEKRISDKIDEINEKVARVEGRLTTAESKISDLESVKNQYLNTIAHMENKSVMNEYHSMKFNVVIYNLLQSKDWETYDELIAVLTDFLAIIEVDISALTIKAIHRLHSKKATKPLPLIIKLESIQQREILLKGAYTKLKAHNATLHSDMKPLFAVQQMPYRMQQDRFELKEDFNRLKNNGNKPKYIIDNSSARIWIKAGNTVVKPQRTTLRYEPANY